MCSSQQVRHADSVFLPAGGGAAVEGICGQAARVWHFEQHIVSLRRVRQHGWAANGGADTVVSCRWNRLASRLQCAHAFACNSPPADLHLVWGVHQAADPANWQACKPGPCTKLVPAAVWLCLVRSMPAQLALHMHFRTNMSRRSQMHAITTFWCLPCRLPSLWAC